METGSVVQRGLYRTVLRQGPNVVHQRFPPAPPDARAHLRRGTTVHNFLPKLQKWIWNTLVLSRRTVQHCHQLKRKPRELEMYDMICLPFRSYNSILPSIFPAPPSLSNFKHRLFASL